MNDIELPPLSKFDHPEPRTMQWSDLELYAIKSYARAAVEADRAQRVPDGWKLVPVEPTEEMLNCGPAPANEAEKFAADLAAGYRKNIWAAMLASTPAPAQQEPNWWRKRADEIELTVARSGSTDAMRCYTNMRALLQSAAQHQEPPQQERKPMTGEEVIEGLSEIGVTVWGPRSEDFERGVRFAERHHGIKE